MTTTVGEEKEPWKGAGPELVERLHPRLDASERRPRPRVGSPDGPSREDDPNAVESKLVSPTPAPTPTPTTTTPTSTPTTTDSGGHDPYAAVGGHDPDVIAEGSGEGGSRDNSVVDDLDPDVVAGDSGGLGPPREGGMDHPGGRRSSLEIFA